MQKTLANFLTALYLRLHKKFRKLHRIVFFTRILISQPILHQRNDQYTKWSLTPDMPLTNYVDFWIYFGKREIKFPKYVMFLWNFHKMMLENRLLPFKAYKKSSQKSNTTQLLTSFFGKLILIFKIKSLNWLYR